MKALRKSIAGIMAMSMTLTICSCSNSKSGNGNSPDKQNSQSVQQVLDKAYSAIELEDIPIRNISIISQLGDSGEFLVTGYDENYETSIFIADGGFSEFRSVGFSLDKSGNKEGNFSAYPASDGTIAVRSEITDYGDFEIPDWEDPDFDKENFDYDAFRAAAQTTYRMSILDRKGSVLSENEITGLDRYQPEEDDESYFYVGELFPCGEDFLIRLGGSDGERYVVIGADGVLGDEVELGEDVWLDCYGEDANGNFVYTMWEDGKNVLKTLDPDTMKVGGEAVSLEDNGYIRCIAKGTGDHLAYLSTESGLVGLNADGSTDEIINWMDSDIVGQYVRSVTALDNDDFLIVYNNWNDNSTKVYRMTKADPSEFDSVKLIDLVTIYSSTELLDKVNEFNRENTEYRIRTEDYGKYYEFGDDGKMINSPENQLKMDLAAGKTFDIFCFDSYDSALFQTFSNKGMFADLYQLMDSTGNMSKDDFLPNILSLNETDGKLTSLPISFSVETLAVKKKFADKESWTIDEMAEIYEGLSDKMSLISFCYSKPGVFTTLYDSLAETFADVKKGTSSFDSPEFVKLLEFCDGLDIPVEEPDWEHMTNEENEANYMENFTAPRNDKALTMSVYLSSPREYIDKRYGTFGEEISLIGYPSVSGNGALLHFDDTYAIFESSPYKEVCWDFITTLFEGDANENAYRYRFPVIKEQFEKYLDEGMEDPYYYDNNGKKQTYKNTVYISDSQPSVEVPNLTKEERDMLEEYVLSATYVKSYNDSIRDIVSEEATAFFHGERSSAQETADMIQSRVSILVSEQS